MSTRIEKLEHKLAVERQIAAARELIAKIKLAVSEKRYGDAMMLTGLLGDACASLAKLHKEANAEQVADKGAARAKGEAAK